MRIGIDARLLAYQPAGISTYTRSLARALAGLQSGDDLVLLRSRRDRDPIVDGPRVAHRALWTPPHHRWEQVLLPLELLPAGLDVLHCPDFIPPFRIACPSVITVHDLCFRLFPETVTTDSLRYYNQIDRAVRHAAAIVAVSESTRRDLVELTGAPSARIRVIPEAAAPEFVPLHREEAARQVRARLGVEAPFILFVSTIEPRKNLPTLLRALTLPRMASIRLAVAGGRGWLSEDVFRLVGELGLEQRVHFLGRQPVEDIVCLYNAADLVVYPSLYEGFGLPVLEAMACGTPVACSRVSSLPEVAGDAAVLVEPLALEAWADAITRILSDRALWQALREKGLRRAAEFSWERAARETLAVYRSVAK